MGPYSSLRILVFLQSPFASVCVLIGLFASLCVVMGPYALL